MLRIYRVIGGLLGLTAVWTAALRTSVQPAQHLALLLVGNFLCGTFLPAKLSN